MDLVKLLSIVRMLRFAELFLFSLQLTYPVSHDAHTTAEAAQLFIFFVCEGGFSPRLVDNR